MVPNLQNLPGNSSFRFTGTECTQDHMNNHYGTWYTNLGVQNIAIDFKQSMNATLGINDMSLGWGGIFDICGTWNTSSSCDCAKLGGHFSHRFGSDVDIVNADKAFIKKLCENYGSGLVKEEAIHCRFW